MEQHLKVEMAQLYVHLRAVSAPSGWVSVCHWVSHVCSELPGLCVSRQKHQPGFSVHRDAETHLPIRVYLHGSPLPGPSTPNPGSPFHACDAALSPSRLSPRGRATARLPGCADAPPPRRVAASTLTCVCFLCPFRCGLGSTPSLPPLRRPRPPAQPLPEPATHTSELFRVFQQLKRIKQQLSPGRAWILVTLIFCVAGQGEWGY